MTLVLGEIMEGRPKDTVRDKSGKVTSWGQDDLYAILDGRKNPEASSTASTVPDDSIRKAYEADGYSDLRIRMLEEMRHASSPVEKAQIRARYEEMAAAK